jgi:hypothetical protein
MKSSFEVGKIVCTFLEMSFSIHIHEFLLGIF